MKKKFKKEDKPDKYEGSETWNWKLICLWVPSQNDIGDKLI